jgi:hypothetical protein
VTVRLLSLVTAGAVLLGALAGCGSDDTAGSGATTTVEPEFRVLLVGDSVMENMQPALLAAFAGDPRVATHFVLQATISRENSELLWYRLHRDYQPDVVVMLVGFWEISTEAFQDRSQRAAYVAEHLDPLADFVTADGTELLWVGMPAVRNPVQSADYVELNTMLAAQAEDRLDVDYVDGGQFLNAPDGSYAEFLPSVFGPPERVRRNDRGGLHLCPAGVVRLAYPILEWVGMRYPFTPAIGWENGSWRRPPELPDPEQCPAS